MRRLLLSSALVTLAVPALAQDRFRAGLEDMDIRASQLMGQRVYASEAAIDAGSYDGLQDGWEAIGSIDDLVVNRSGEVQAVLVDIGGFLGLGARTVAISMDQLQFVGDDATADDVRDYFLVLNASRADLEAAPALADLDMGAAEAAEATETAVEDAAAAATATAVAAGEATAEVVDDAADGTAEAVDDAAAATADAADDAATAVAANDAVQATENAVEETGEELADGAAEVADEVADAGAEVAEEVDQLDMTAEQAAADEAADEAADASAETTEEAAQATDEAADEAADATEEATEEAAAGTDEGAMTETTDTDAAATADATADATVDATTESAAADTATATTDATMPAAIEREGYALAAAEELTAERLTGVTVYDTNDDRVGVVGDLNLTAEGQVSQMIVDVGGFLGIGAKPVAIELEQVTILRADGGDELRVYVPMTRDELDALPRFE